MANDVDLTTLQSRFIEEYLSDPDRNASKAYIRAGGSVNSAAQNASVMLRKPHVAKVIEERQGKAADVVGINEVRILQELAKIGFSNIQDFAAMTEDGRSIRDVPREHAAAIKEITIEQTDNGKFSVKKTKLSMADKQAALIQMGKHIGMFKDKVEHTGVFSFQKLVEDSLLEPEVIDVTPVETSQLEDLSE